MKAVAAAPMSVEEYIRHEWTAACRSEYIHGKLFPMAGEKDINNALAGRLYILLTQMLEAAGYLIYNHDVKVAVPGGSKYYYPDVFVTAEPRTPDNQYIKREPVLIVEVVSESTHKTDYVDKYIDYTGIPSLQYYLIVEPDTTLVTVCERTAEDWVQHKYTAPDATIELSKLGLQISVADVYKGVR